MILCAWCVYIFIEHFPAWSWIEEFVCVCMCVSEYVFYLVTSSKKGVIMSGVLRFNVNTKSFVHQAYVNAQAQIYIQTHTHTHTPTNMFHDTVADTSELDTHIKLLQRIVRAAK